VAVDDVATVKTYSAFAEFDLKLPANLQFTGGARYTYEKKLAIIQDNYENDNIVPLFQALTGAPMNPFLPVGDVIHAPTVGVNISPEATLSWHPERNLNLYVSYKTGYKSGGTSESSSPSPSTAASLSFKPETSSGFEVGSKGEWMHGALRGDLVVYDYTFRNLQVNELDESVIPPSFSVTNAAEAKTIGFEAQGSFQVNENLALRGNLGYNHGYYQSYKGAECYTALNSGLAPGGDFSGGTCSRDESGLQLPRAPDWTAGAGVSYTHNVASDLLITLTTDLIYTGKYNPADELIPALEVSGYARVNAGIKLSDPATGWEVSLTGSNLTNKVVDAWGYDRPGAGPGGVYFAQTTPPREVTLAVGYKF
jgi:iron complex outermembrane receptor protein